MNLPSPRGNMSDDNECPGDGLCHGCLRWCSCCGDVSHVCDARLRGERCEAHPVPPSWSVLRTARAGAEKKRLYALRLDREALNEFQEVVDGENARRAYDRQVAEQERLACDGTTS
jgi:hypothetical protein